MKYFCVFLFFLTLSSCCLLNSPTEPTIIEVPQKRRPVSELLRALGENLENPVLAKSPELELRQKELIDHLMLKYGKVEIKNLLRRQMGMQKVKEYNIEISSSAVEARAKEILTHQNMSLSDYMAMRSISKLTWVNEITVQLSLEELCRYELIQSGAICVKAKVHKSEADAQAKGVKDAVASWYAPYLIQDDNLKRDLFKTKVPKTIQSGSHYFAVEVVKRVDPTALNENGFKEALQNLHGWIPEKQVVNMMLDHLLESQKVTYFWEHLTNQETSGKLEAQ